MQADCSEECERLRARMDRLRHKLDHDVDQVADKAADLLDWRFYVESYPLTSMGVLALLAYHCVPKRTYQRVTIDDSAVQEILNHNEEPPNSSPPVRPSFARTILETTGHALFRTALALATRKLVTEVVTLTEKIMEKSPGPTADSPETVRKE